MGFLLLLFFVVVVFFLNQLLYNCGIIYSQSIKNLIIIIMYDLFRHNFTKSKKNLSDSKNTNYRGEC